MKNFNFFIPTKIIFGKGRINELNENLPEKFNNIMIVTGKNSAKKSGALDKIKFLLKDKNLILFDKTEENPSFDILEKGRELAKKEKVEIIIGLGGGSPMDAAKGIALLTNNEGSMRDYMKGKTPSKDILPIVCIPTTSGTGSEVTPYAVFTDPENEDKGGYANTGLFPIFSIIDPELTYSMPETLIINTGIDALTHALEGYFSTKANILNDYLAIHSIEIITGNIKDAAKKDKSAMDRLSYASMVAGIVISNAGTLFLHAAGYPLTVYHKIPHGLANAILLPAFINFLKQKSNIKEKIEIIESIFEQVGGIESFLNELGIKTKLSAYNINKEELRIFVKKTIHKKNLLITPAKITEQDIYDFYESIL